VEALPVALTAPVPLLSMLTSVNAAVSRPLAAALPVAVEEPPPLLLIEIVVTAADRSPVAVALPVAVAAPASLFTSMFVTAAEPRPRGPLVADEVPLTVEAPAVGPLATVISV
jgi:hypothetical protein